MGNPAKKSVQCLTMAIAGGKAMIRNGSLTEVEGRDSSAKQQNK